MPKYTEGVLDDGAVILEDGEKISIPEILYKLNLAEKIKPRYMVYAKQNVELSLKLAELETKLDL